MRRVTLAGAFVLAFMFAIYIGDVIHTYICEYPEYSYQRSINETALMEDCKHLQPSTTVRASVQFLERSAEPAEERLDDTRILVRQNRTVCVIDFEPSTNLVTKTETQTLSGTLWDPRSF